MASKRAGRSWTEITSIHSGLRAILCMASALCWLGGLQLVSADIRNAMRKQRARHEQFAQRLAMSAPFVTDNDDGLRKRQDGSTIHFSNPKAQEFFVDGKTIPLVPFDAGPSWSGLMPISGAKNETRKLFFWFWPTTNVSNANDLLFWTNGGPGCSSLEGFLQENGPISWPWGQAQPTSWSWTNLSNVVWVDQPVGAGFSQGEPNISNDDELAAQVVGFLQQFLEVFSELKGSNFWLSGESIYEHTSALDLKLKGVWIADPVISYDTVQQEIPALRFAQANKNVFPFNSSFVAELQRISDLCGYTDYLGNSVHAKEECHIWESIFEEVSVLNPAWNVYRVTETWPMSWSVTGFPELTQKFIYFNRTDTLLHAPHIDWEICSEGDVYVNATTGQLGSDQSIYSTLSVLPNVIEKSERVAIVHGLADYILLAEGTRIAIQNMTWNGAQGFQTPIQDESFHVKDMGVYGNMHQERGLTYVEFYYSGHMTPQFVPWAAFQTIAYYVLGKADSPSA
ncbi:hypothetical protein EVG20_g5147 [Dentipellis fragilis]|uniref:Carboxypeptidase n=1 Tax=Dentipellis fragilis TaxID=205917 RepID=A0A4Y9YW36_9AGAM|nr:hypothetical protein EVG20_g5147 [Dentipellis fragilis]